MKILLANDTATKSHIGCQAVSDAHARLLGRAGHRVTCRLFVNALRGFARGSFAETVGTLERQEALMAQLDAADALVVNGEGTLHHDNGIPWLALLALAQQRGKATLLVNALYQEMSVGTDVLARLDAFFVRDPLSAAYVKRLGIECREAPDSIVAARFSEPPRITFDGGLVVTDWVKKRDGDVGAAMTALMADPSSEAPPSFYPLHSETARTAWDRACADIATAGAVISGRYHGLYLALLAGVPVVPMASNSWKVDAFVKAWGLPVGPCADARAARAALKGQETEFRDAAERMAAARTLPIFDVLGQGSEDTDETREVARLRSDVAGQPDALAADALAVAKRRLREAAMRVDLLSGKVPGRARGPFGRILRRLGG